MYDVKDIIDQYFGYLPHHVKLLPVTLWHELSWYSGWKAYPRFLLKDYSAVFKESGCCVVASSGSTSGSSPSSVSASSSSLVY